MQLKEEIWKRQKARWSESGWHQLECQHPKVWIDAASFGLPRWTREDLPHSYWKWVLLLNRKTS
jgi:hypothetical protein